MSPTRAAEQEEKQRQAEAEKRRAEEEAKRKEDEKRFYEELKVKRQETRIKVIDEIMQTERDYLRCLSLVCDNFLSPEAEKVNIISFNKR